MDNGKKNITIITICSLLLVAMVVALVIASRESIGNDNIRDVSGSKKAIAAICQTTDYQKTCMDSLNGQNSTNPKELIQVAFQAAIDYLKDTIKKSTTLQELQTDPRAKVALDTCSELFNRAVDDLHRSYAKFTSFDITYVDDVLLDMKTWLSGAITHQETCLDGFDEVSGDASTKMKNILTTSMEMTSNALAMVAEIATFLESMGVQGFQSRRLLSNDVVMMKGQGGEVPYWVGKDRRKLASVRPQKIKPDIVVAKDGSGNYRTVNEGLKALPKNSNRTVVLYIKEGVYKEQVRINSSLKHLMMIGDGPTKTRITGDLNFIDGTGTYHTATIAVQGDYFIARDIGFENSAGPQKHQAVALRVSGDKAIFYNCHMDGYQDTLYAHTYRQFYRDCVISGTIDFIFGDSAAVFQGCTLVVRKPLSNQQNIVTAQGRKDVRQPTGLVLQNCTFKADPELHPIRHKVKSYLGRPWKEFSRTIIMESFLDDLIHPDGWLPWNQTFALETLFYTEFNNRGPASPKAERVKWAGVKELPATRIQRFTAAMFLDGNRWVPSTRVPYSTSFIFPVPKVDPNIKYSPVVPEENKDLGHTTTIDKSAFPALNKKNNTSPPAKTNSYTPPPPPPPPPVDPIPKSNIASPPTSLFPHDETAASPSPLGAGTIPNVPIPGGETGEVIIDLTPIVAPTPSPTYDVNLPAPAPSRTYDVNLPAPAPVPFASRSIISPSPSPIEGQAPTPQPYLAPSPSRFPNGSPDPYPRGDLVVAPSLSPMPSHSASPPQSDLTNTPSLSPTSDSASPLQADTTASPPTASLGPTTFISQSDVTNAPTSSFPLVGAPSLSSTL